MHYKIIENNFKILTFTKPKLKKKKTHFNTDVELGAIREIAPLATKTAETLTH